MNIEAMAARIWEAARELGLEPHPVSFEVVPHHVLYEVAAYGLPNHFQHWTYGRNYWLQKQQYEHGLAKIYELAINSDPVLAYILQNNSDVQKAFVMAHVMGHSHVFKCNGYWQETRKDMPQYMSAASTRFAEYEQVYGALAVERLIDRGLSLQFHVADEHHEPVPEPRAARIRTEFDDLLDLGRRAEVSPTQEKTAKPRHRVPPGRPNRLAAPTEDVLGYIIRYSPVLMDWERDILTVIREEGIYLAPYYRTKLLHEGFAVWTHQKILSMLGLTHQEQLEAAVTHAGVAVPHPLGINPYYLGWKILEKAEERYGRDEVIRIAGEEGDASLVRNYLDEAMVEEFDLYRWVRREEGGRPNRDLVWVVETTGWREVRDWLANRYARAPFPRIEVVDVDDQRGDLVLWQVGDENMDRRYAAETLKYCVDLWGGDVKLSCNLDGRREVMWRQAARS